MKAKTEDQAEYIVMGEINTAYEDKIIAEAAEICKHRAVKKDIISSPKALIDYLHLAYSEKRKEMFGVVLLNAKNMIIRNEVIQTGTIDQTAVYPREIVRTALMDDATSVILYHNHPSGDPAPSSHDIRLTEALKSAFNLFSIKLHDHIIIGRLGYYSFAENGCL